MKKVTIKEYARMHKMSIFHVIKKIKSEELKSETITENGSEKVFIMIEEQSVEKQEKQTKKAEHKESLEEENERLKAEIVRLKNALKRCKKGILI